MLECGLVGHFLMTRWKQKNPLLSAGLFQLHLLGCVQSLPLQGRATKWELETHNEGRGKHEVIHESARGEHLLSRNMYGSTVPDSACNALHCNCCRCGLSRKLIQGLFSPCLGSNYNGCSYRLWLRNDDKASIIHCLGCQHPSCTVRMTSSLLDLGSSFFLFWILFYFYWFDGSVHP